MIVERSMDPALLSNAYLVATGSGGPAVVIDTGAPLESIFRRIEAERLRVRAILNTHRHGDHTAGNDRLAKRTGAPVFALDREVAHIPGASALRPDERTDLDGLAFVTIPLPGHTAGQAGFLVEGVGLFTGDCLFAGSVGGTVGPASSGFEDARSAIERILTLPDDTAVHPGHAGPTSVGRERRENPIVAAMTGRADEDGRACRALGRDARLVALATDYDGGTKAWVRFRDDGRDAIVPGSRLEL